MASQNAAIFSTRFSGRLPAMIAALMHQWTCLSPNQGDSHSREAWHKYQTGMSLMPHHPQESTHFFCQAHCLMTSYCMNQPWLTINDWPLKALVSNAANNNAT